MLHYISSLPDIVTTWIYNRCVWLRVIMLYDPQSIYTSTPSNATERALICEMRILALPTSWLISLGIATRCAIICPPTLSRSAGDSLATVSSKYNPCSISSKNKRAYSYFNIKIPVSEQRFQNSRGDCVWESLTARLLFRFGEGRRLVWPLRCQKWSQE